MKLTLTKSGELEGSIAITTDWAFHFVDGGLDGVEVNHQRRDGTGYIREAVPIEAVPAEIRKEATDLLVNMAYDLEMPGEDL